MSKTQITIPTELLAEFEAWGQATAELFGKLRERAGLPPKNVPEDQAWFWTDEWQAMEREVDEALAKGDYVEFQNMDEAIKYLHDQV
jgi:hypothetical protein